MSATYLAVDFGGGSGRVMAGKIVDGNVHLDEVYRFPNYQVRLGEHLYWDFPYLFSEMLAGLRKAAGKYDDIKSIGIDTWGVDFGLTDRAGNLLENPRCYRDEANITMPEKVFHTIDEKAHYARTGILPQPINSLFQLTVRLQENPELLGLAQHLLFMPDLFSFYLTGIANNEYTIASTSELLDARTRDWDYELIDALGFPREMFCEIIMPGSVRGTILHSIAAATGLPASVKVIAAGSHDTASAVYAVPFEKYTESVSAFLSSGTWSLLGILSDQPVLTEEARSSGFSNEGGVGGKIRFLQNITGLWILQCLIEEWKAQKLCVDYDVILREAEASDFNGIFDVDAPQFASPGNMRAKIAEYFANRGLQVPRTRGDVARSVLASLADRYRRGIEQLNSLLPKPVERLHIIGGGCRNKLLNRLTSEATGLPVIAGPVEATAIGNILLQSKVP